MKILQLTKKVPFPPKDGESIAINSLAKGLAELDTSISLLAMNTSKHYYEGPDLKNKLPYYESIDMVPVNNDLHWWAALQNLFSPQSYHIQRFVNDAYAQRLQVILEQENYDIVQLETLYLAPYIPVIRRYSKARICLRAHNIEHEIWERIARHTPKGPRRWYLQYLSQKLKRFELQQLNEYDLIAPISARDETRLRELGLQGPSTVIPIGMETPQYPFQELSLRAPHSISFIGSLDWMPNQEGLQWFLDKIWPKLATTYPQLKFHIAGRNTPESFYRYASKQVVVHGEVPSSVDFLSQHPIMVVPLLSGSGMRAKILEAMALGRQVITTRVGLEGIGAEHGQEVLIADRLEEWQKAFQLCFEELTLAPEMAHRARQFVQEHYHYRAVAKRLKASYATLELV